MAKSRCAAVIVKNSNGQILLILRDSKPDIEYPNMWSLPAGLARDNETPEQAIRREAREEIHYRNGHNFELSNLQFVRIYNRTDIKRNEYVFHATLQESLDSLQLTEGQELRLFTKQEIESSNAIPPHHKQYILEYIDIQKQT